MDVLTGLFDHMVLQRGRRGLSDARVTGRCGALGAVKARAVHCRRVVAGLDGVAIGRSNGRAFKARIRGLPTGGPYDVTLWVESASGKPAEQIEVRDVLVGDVWLLGGQSNMQGCGYMAKSPPPVPHVRAFFMDDHWGVGQELLHDFHLTVDRVHLDLMGGVRPPPAAQITVGPGLFYAQELFRQTGVPQGIIPCAHGGTTMAQWDPKLKSRGRRSLYGALCRRLAKNGGRVAGLLWYQGCSDANTSTAPLYTKRMEALIRSVRRDTSDPRLPIAVVQISRVVNWDPNQTAAWNSIQDQQRRLPHRVPRCTVVPAIDLTLGDSIHLDAAGQERLGRRLVYAVRALLEGSIAGLPPLDVGRIEVVPNRVNGMADVVVHVNHVVGRLAAPGRPNGFELAGQAAAAGVHRIDLDGSRAILRTTSSRLAVEGSVLYYGRGFHPYCNIGDEAGRSLPVMGPLYVGEPRALTPFAQRLRVSRFLPSAGTLNGLVRPPADLGALGLRSREFPGQFADLHGDYAAGDATDQLVYFACAIECARRMRLSVNLGYDGPVRMWVNGRSVFHDPKGTNPAWPDMATVPFSAAPGRHEVLVALATNRNRAWGIFLRFGRLDLTRRQIEAQPPAYAMPSVLG